MENCVFKKLHLEDNTPIRIYITLVKNSLKLIILQNENAWKSFVISEKLNHFAIQHKLSLENYTEKLLEYVKNENSDIAFVMIDEEFVINRLLNKNLKLKYFTCKLEKVNYVEQAEQIIDTFYSENMKSMEKLNSTIKEKNEIETYKISCEIKLKELIEKKRTDEEELFGHFILILNEKKQRIQHLTELLEAFRAGRPSVNPTVTVKNRKKKSNIDLPVAVKKLETISESEPSESSNSNTETDDEYISPKEQYCTSNKDCEPSTSTQTFSFLENDAAETPILPKRAKRDKNLTENTAVIPSTSKSPLHAMEDNENNEEFKSTDKKDSPSIDLSTQQLLDML